jgi:hypothetical protein
MLTIKKAGLVCVSSLLGVFVGTAIATPVIALMNYLATDGPIFPPPLVALGLLALPVAVLLLITQVLLVLYEIASNHSLGSTWLLLALLAGSLAGFTWYLVLKSSQSGPLFAVALIAFGVIQAICVFSCHWLAHKLGFAVPEPNPHA